MADVVDVIIPGDPQITNLLEKSTYLEQWRSQAVFHDSDIVTQSKLREALHECLRRVQACMESTVKSIGENALVADVVDRLHKHQTLTEFVIQVMQRLLRMKGSLDVDTIVAKHTIPAAAALMTQQSHTFLECLDYYILEEGGSIHGPEIYPRAHMETAEADETLKRYFLEGSRLACSLSMSRRVDFAHNIMDKGESMELNTRSEGHLRYVISLPGVKIFLDRSSVHLGRNENLYWLCGWSPSGDLDPMNKIALVTMLKTDDKLKSLRRAQGQLNAVEGPRGFMNAEQSRYSTFLKQYAKTVYTRPDFPLELFLK